MSISNDGFGTLFNQVYTGGGGGVTIIEDGGSLSGDYTGNVYCEGDVTIDGNFVVKGDLFVVGTVTGTQSHGFEVQGSVYSHNWVLTPDDGTTSQGNINIGGSFYYTGFDWPQGGGVGAEFRVGGTVTGTLGGSGSPFSAAGITGTGSPGASILVYGSWYSGLVTLDGANADGSPTAASGGNFTIYGNAVLVDDFRSRGGSGSEGANAGGGGTVDVYGDFSSDNRIRLQGGYGYSSDGGFGGSLTVEGDLVCRDVYTYGGDADYNGGSAGFISVNGSMTVRDIVSHGGYGGNGSGGSGATIYVDGELVADEIEIYAGDGADGMGGTGGELGVIGSAACSAFYGRGGNGVNGNGGQGAVINVGGDLSISGDFEFSGGESEMGGGGNGGSCNVTGNIYCSYLNAAGGFCDSTDSSHAAGYGGSVDCNELNVANNTVDLSGGNRSGITTSSNLGASTSNAGNIYANGDVFIGTLNANGGDVSTDYSNRVGGSGGQLFISGSLTAEQIHLNGGFSNGNDGGAGGQCRVYGKSCLDYISASGGGSFPSTDGPATNAGPASSSLKFQGGIIINELVSIDGADGTAPTAASNLYLGGTCQFGICNVSGRAGSYIRSFGESVSVIFQAGSMPDKNTLNTWDLSDESNDISGDLTSSIFMTTSIGSGNWYKLSGISIM